MLPISSKDWLPFTPEALKDRDDAPVFMVKVPSLRDKIALDYEVAAAGVRYPTNEEYAKALRAAVLEHVIYDDQPNLLQIIEEFEAAIGEGTLASEEVNERIEEIARVLRPVDLPLGKIQGERVRFLQTAFLVRAEMLVMAIEGLDAPPVERRAGKLSERCLEAIERRYGMGTVSAIGAHIANLLTPTEDERKNSPSLPALPPGPETSTEEKKPPTARHGKSSANGTSEIHA